MRVRVKCLGTATLCSWPTQTQFSAATDEHGARVCSGTTACVAPVVLWEAEDLTEIGLVLAAQNFVVWGFTWARLKVDQLVDGLAKHVVVNLSVNGNVGKEHWVFLFVLNNRLACQVFQLPCSACRWNTLKRNKLDTKFSLINSCMRWLEVILQVVDYHESKQ